MKIARPLVEGVFLSRDNRFRASVRVGDRVVAPHVPNSGRFTELLTPGSWQRQGSLNASQGMTS